MTTRAGQAITWIRINEQMWAGRSNGQPAGVVGRERTGEYVAFNRFGEVVETCEDFVGACSAVETASRRDRRAGLHGLWARLVAVISARRQRLTS